MDADLQDPPETVLDLISKWREGYDIVYAVRRVREGETFFKKITAKLYYRILRRLSQIDIPADTGDFRLVDRGALEAFLSMREGHRFVRGLYSWVGFKQIGVEFDRQERFAGETHYPLKKMLKLALDGILSFSYVPLRLVMQLGLMVALFSVILCAYAGYGYFHHQVIRGWTSLFIGVAFFGGVQLIAIGMLGEYIGRIHEELKRRPLYIVNECIGFEPSGVAPERTVRVSRHGPRI
jgi:dolichol-phosphate mannosyltransferase